MACDPAWIETALAITGGFETAGDPFAAVAGDFDGQGLSLGALQWNIGQGTLQPLVLAAGLEPTLGAMPDFGPALWRAVHVPIGEALAIVRGWQDAARLHPDAQRELATFAGGAPMRAQQVAAAGKVAARAFRGARRWSEATQGGAPTRKTFFWFFDLVTQNGGLKGLGPADVNAFLAAHGAKGGGAVICDWLAERGPDEPGWRDCRRNARAWRRTMDAPDRALLVLSYLRALKSRRAWRGAVLNRKGTLALGSGWVNGKPFELPAESALS